jgi:hypothetical protein
MSALLLIAAIALLILLSTVLLLLAVWVYCGHLADEAGQRRTRR